MRVTSFAGVGILGPDAGAAAAVAQHWSSEPLAQDGELLTWRGLLGCGQALGGLAPGLVATATRTGRTGIRSQDALVHACFAVLLVLRVGCLFEPDRARRAPGAPAGRGLAQCAMSR